MARLPDGGHNLKPGDSRVTRRQHCIRCDTVLAVTVENEPWWRLHGDGPWVRQRWYGNHVRCPGCGIEGNLPMDKPLSYESSKIMQEVLR